jgi:hypothetical protein
MFVVLDYLLKMKNCFFQELIVLLLTIKLTVEVTNLEMYFDVQRLQLNELKKLLKRITK